MPLEWPRIQRTVVVTYKDLRGFIKQVDELGALRRINGADARFELGGITEVAAGTPECPAILFDRIKGLAPGFRVFTNATTTPQRAALALGLDPTLKPLDALKAWMGKRQTLKALKPVAVESAAFMANSFRGRKVDLRTLPAPHWHRKDGGPFIGSGSIVIMRDPDGGWINGGFFVLSPRCLDYIEGDQSSWEGQPLARISGEGQLMAFEHAGFWQPMDTLHDKNNLEKLWASGKAPWKVW